MPSEKARHDAEGEGQRGYNLPHLASYLGATLEIQCNSESPLILLKALSIRLFSAVLLQKYLEPSVASLNQFREDIDQAHEQSPDAKSLEDFYEFALDILDQVKNCLDPIAFLTRRCPILNAFCQESSSAASHFAKSTRQEIQKCSQALCEFQADQYCNSPLEEQLRVLQSLDIEVRMTQHATVRSCLDRLQTLATETVKTLENVTDKIRIESGKLRVNLSQAEQLCNSHGQFDAPELSLALQDLKLFQDWTGTDGK